MYTRHDGTSAPIAQVDFANNPGIIIPVGCEQLPPAPTYPGPQARVWTGENGVTCIQPPSTPTAREAAQNARITATYAAACARATTGALRAQYLAQARHFSRAARDLLLGRRSPTRSARAARERLDGGQSPSFGLRARTRASEGLRGLARPRPASHRSRGARQHRAGPRSRPNAAGRGAGSGHSCSDDDPASSAPRPGGSAVVRAGGRRSSPPPFRRCPSFPRPEDQRSEDLPGIEHAEVSP